MDSMKAGAAAVPAVTTVVAVPAVIAAPMPQPISPPTTPPPTAPAATAQPLKAERIRDNSKTIVHSSSSG